MCMCLAVRASTILPVLRSVCGPVRASNQVCCTLAACACAASAALYAHRPDHGPDGALTRAGAGGL